MSLPIHACEVTTDEGERIYVTLLPPETAFQRGLPPETILGVLSRLPTENESITPEIFTVNRVFVDFLHGMIERRGPSLPELIAEAKRQRDGMVCLVDLRTSRTDGSVPPEDIIGVFEVRAGQLGKYTRNPNHRVLTRDGFLRLHPELEACLLGELKSPSAQKNRRA